VCGLTGFILSERCHRICDLKATVEGMLAPISHRGPDDSGVWTDNTAGVALGHRRLSIIDLSSAGHQPMVSASGRYVATLNGEIYNHQELRNRFLANYPFVGYSDAETAVAMFQELGFSEALQHFVGMFAFAVWDRRESVLYLARDRMGEKPLYYGTAPGAFLYGSELKALRSFPHWVGEVDRQALGLFLTYRYVPAPSSIFVGIKKLEPGCWIAVNRRKMEDVPVRSFWSMKEVIVPTEHRSRSTPEVVAGELEKLLLLTVAGQTVADRPVGAFLSGGVDSSLIVALMQVHGCSPVKTFSLGFSDNRYNEAHHAKSVARHLGTDHTELYIRTKDAQDVIPLLSGMYDEPFADASQIPMSLVSKLARSQVAVCLSGDGGDELFGGYPRYAAGRTRWSRMAAPSRLSQLLNFICAFASKSLSQDTLDSFWRFCRSFLPSRLAQKDFVSAVQRRGRGWPPPTQEQFYQSMLSLWEDTSRVVVGLQGGARLGAVDPRLGDFTEKMMFLDALQYLPDDILVKVDRASMAQGLEVRAPFLDHRIVEFAWRLPLEMKVREGVEKWPLKQILHRYVPKELVDRPKMGFGVPLGRWLREDLRDWAEELLSEYSLNAGGYFHPRPIRDKWLAHLNQSEDCGTQLWPILVFQSWLQR
jgi:asparagine synthase (glutamine-hydrolysing)